MLAGTEERIVRVIKLQRKLSDDTPARLVINVADGRTGKQPDGRTNGQLTVAIRRFAP